MMRIFLAIGIFLSFTVHGQKIKTRTRTIDVDSCHLSNSEKYHVLADDGVTLQGHYEKFDHLGKILEEGYYKNGKKDSLWTQYDAWQSYVTAQGVYKDGKRIGIWIFDWKPDTIALKYDFDKNIPVYFRKDTANKTAVLYGNDTVKVVLDQPPFYLDCGEIGNVINNCIEYPELARENNVEGRVLVAFTVFPDGHASPPWIKKGVHKSIDDEALRVAGKLTGQWLPGVLNGKPVTSIYQLPITFLLE